MGSDSSRSSSCTDASFSSSTSVSVTASSYTTLQTSTSPSPELEAKEELTSLDSNYYVRKIIVVTQANHEVATSFALYKNPHDTLENAICEYFRYRRPPKSKSLAWSSTREEALALRRKILYSTLEFYQDILTNPKTKVYIFTDLADYNFTEEINTLLKKIENSHELIVRGHHGHQRFEQIKNYSPNKLFHCLSTENPTRKMYGAKLAMIQKAAAQLQLNRIKSFKSRIGPSTKISCISKS